MKLINGKFEYLPSFDKLFFGLLFKKNQEKKYINQLIDIDSDHIKVGHILQQMGETLLHYKEERDDNDSEQTSREKESGDPSQTPGG